MASARRRFPKLFGAHPAASNSWLRLLRAPTIFAVFLAIAALFQGFLDPSFGWNTSSLWLFLGWAAGVAVVTLGFQLPAVILGVRTQHRVRFEGSRARSSWRASACSSRVRSVSSRDTATASSRSSPSGPCSPKSRAGPWLRCRRSSCWRSASRPSPSSSRSATRRRTRIPRPPCWCSKRRSGWCSPSASRACRSGCCPCRSYPGRDVANWNRWAWAGVFGLGTIAFVWLLLQPGSGLTSEIHHVDLIPVVVTCAVFAAAPSASWRTSRSASRRSPPKTRTRPPSASSADPLSPSPPPNSRRSPSTR